VNRNNFNDSKRIIEGCCNGELKFQELLYKQYYSYGMSIALRYATNREDSKEILNDSFLKVFKNINFLNTNKSFKPWFRQIIINTAIDKYRTSLKWKNNVEYETINEDSFNSNILDNLMAEDIIKIIQKLDGIYRMVFNLYELEGLSHEEISKELNIKVSTSRSNLTRAKKKLRNLIVSYYEYERT
jgi:RNA polymerase sigma-70 factor (ECF subfamily)